MVTPQDVQKMKEAGWELRETYDTKTGKFSLRLYSTRGDKSPHLLFAELTEAANAGNALSRRVLQTIMKSHQ